MAFGRTAFAFRVVAQTDLVRAVLLRGAACKTVEVGWEGSKKKNLLHFSLGGIMQKVLGRIKDEKN